MFGGAFRTFEDIDSESIKHGVTEDTEKIMCSTINFVHVCGEAKLIEFMD